MTTLVTFATVAALVALGVACAPAGGMDAPAAAASVDPEVEPLPPSPKRRMRDPRGFPVVDAGVTAPADASADASVTLR